LIASSGVVVEVETMASVGLDVSLEGRSSRESGLSTSGYVGSGNVLGHAVAVAAAEGNVVLTTDDESGSGEHGHLGCVANGHDLTGSDGLLGFLSLDSEANIEHVGEQEGVLKGGKGGVCEVSRRVIVLEDSVVVTINQVVDLSGGDIVPDFVGVNIDANLVKNGGEARDNIALDTVLRSKSLNAGGGGVTEAEGLV